MGKRQWLLYKVAGDGGCHGGEKASSTSTAGEAKSAGKSRRRGERRSSSSSSSGGCMSAIFHLFDVQHHHFPFQQSHFISESFISIPQEHNFNLKGVEAPRNSLELEEPMVEEALSSSSSSSKLKQETNLNIPMIKTKRTRLIDDLSSECSTSPGTKTPNLVARLMGLDLLPENSSPRPSSSSSHSTPLNPNLSKLTAHRSLPATPRPSTAARPSTELDYHHRLSLQVNKENMGCRRSEGGPRRDDESISEYAKQIAKQVLKESIRRRVGADITNMPEKKKEQRRDECLVLLKPRKPAPAPVSATGKQDETMPLSSSPRLRLLEIKNNLNKPSSNSSKSSPEVVKVPASLNTKPKREVQPMNQVKKCKKIASEKYDLRLKKMHQQEEPFVKKCNKKSTPLSDHLLNVNNKTKFISFKKDVASPPSSTATLPQKQVPLESITQLPSCQSRSYSTKLSVQDNVSATQHNYSNSNAVTTTAAAAAGASFSCDHFRYISTILRHSGIDKSTPISVTHWYSPSHPLHPSIFHTAGAGAGDRKLIFDVVDELLVDILKPYISFKPWAGKPSYSRRMHGSELVGMLCDRIMSFPASDCRILEDIDGLIESDMKSNTRLIGVMAFEEEAEELVTWIERDMIDTLVNEMAVMTWQVGRWGTEARCD